MSNNPFDFLNSINQNKKDIMDPMEESKYPAFMINRGLSYFQDTVLLANEMNRNHHVDCRMQYDFLRSSIRPRKRFSKWVKKENISNVDIVKKYYGYSDAKAESVLDLFTPEQFKEMKQKMSEGGKRR